MKYYRLDTTEWHDGGDRRQPRQPLHHAHSNYSPKSLSLRPVFKFDWKQVERPHVNTKTKGQKASSIELDKPLTNRGFLIGCAYLVYAISSRPKDWSLYRIIEALPEKFIDCWGEDESCCATKTKPDEQ
jgi:hypothetical protein